MIILESPGNSNTFDYQAGDVTYILKSNGHYIENTGTEPLVLLELLKAPTFADISLGQWLALTPTQVVADTLSLPADVVDKFRSEKTKGVIVGGNKTPKSPKRFIKKRKSLRA